MSPQWVEAATTLVTDVFVWIMNAAPEHTFSTQAEHFISVPLIDVIPDACVLVGSVQIHLFTETLPSTDDHLLNATYAALKNNVMIASGLSPYDPPPPKAKYKFPNQQPDLSPKELVETYFRDTELKSFFLTPVPLATPEETRFSGHWIIAGHGRGKTTLLHTMVAQDLPKKACIILMDSKGELLAPFRTLPEIQNRLVIIDPDAANPIGFNPLDVPNADVTQCIAILEYFFSSLVEFKLTASQASLFRNVLRALIVGFKNPTLETFRELLTTNGDKKYQTEISGLPPDLRDFFQHDFNENSSRDRRREILQRLSLLMSNDALRVMFTAVKTQFRISEAMDSGRIVIINNNIDLLTDEGAQKSFSDAFSYLKSASPALPVLATKMPIKPPYMSISMRHRTLSGVTNIFRRSSTSFALRRSRSSWRISGLRR